MPTFKRFPLWFEITLLAGLALIFAVTYWQFKDAENGIRPGGPEVKAPLSEK